MRDVTAHEVVDDWVEGAVEVGQPVRDQRLDRTFSFQQLEVPESKHSKHFLEWCDTQAKVVGRIAYRLYQQPYKQNAYSRQPCAQNGPQCHQHQTTPSSLSFPSQFYC